MKGGVEPLVADLSATLTASMAWLAVALGGALGSMARHAVNLSTAARWPAYPVGTVVVNLVGCFIIGLLAGLIGTKQLTISVYWREFVLVGLLGGFTTFSTFSLETLVLARTHPMQASVNVVIQVVGGLVGAWVGYRCGLAAA
jgi:CrcB protein